MYARHIFYEILQYVFTAHLLCAAFPVLEEKKKLGREIKLFQILINTKGTDKG